MQNKKLTILITFLLSLLAKFSPAQPTQAVLTYIARYKDLAIAEMQRTGIPAAITLAQGIHETEAGTSDLVKKSNNHFGIKCKDNWNGESVSHDDDARGECFRKYRAPEESYKDHSDFLKTRSNYAALFKLDPTDYEAWAYGLKKAGYATNPKYAQILIKLIRDYNLEDYTLMALGQLKDKDGLARNKVPAIINDAAAASARTTEVKSSSAPLPTIGIDYPSGEFKINDTRVVFIKKGTSYLTIAQRYEIGLARLFEFNDLKPQEIADADQLIYIQRKRKTGDHEFHVVQPGENIYSIAQAEAIRLESLLEYNNLGSAMQPAAGETLYLRSKSPSTPKIVDKRTAASNQNNSSQTISINNKPDQRQTRFITHSVQPKETLYSIARRYNVSPDDVASWNHLEDFDLKIGQALKIYK